MKLNTRTYINVTLAFLAAVLLAIPSSFAAPVSNITPSAYYGEDGTIAVTEGKLYTVSSAGTATAMTKTATQLNDLPLAATIVRAGSGTSVKVSMGTTAVVSSATLTAAALGLTPSYCVPGLGQSANLTSGTACSAITSGTTIVLYAWKPTAANDATPVASTTTCTVNWTVWGQ